MSLKLYLYKSFISQENDSQKNEGVAEANSKVFEFWLLTKAFQMQ